MIGQPGQPQFIPPKSAPDGGGSSQMDLFFGLLAAGGMFLAVFTSFWVFGIVLMVASGVFFFLEKVMGVPIDDWVRRHINW